MWLCRSIRPGYRTPSVATGLTPANAGGGSSPAAAIAADLPVVADVQDAVVDERAVGVERDDLAAEGQHPSAT